MAVVVSAPPALSDELCLFYTTDPLLANASVLVFYGAAATIGATSSRIQVHIFTPAGPESYPRLSVSPNSPFYTAVSNLPREEQGDEVCRGLAFGLKKYFAELSENVKDKWCLQAKAPARDALFGDDHVAILATRMTKVDNIEEVTATVSEAFGEQCLSWQDIDVVLPPGSIRKLSRHSSSLSSDELDETEMLSHQYGRYAELVASLGDTTFIPTSKMKRAPSKASQLGRSASFLRHQKENVRKELDELLDTEKSYVGRLRELQDIQKTAAEDDLEQQATKLFPSSFPSILEVNEAFLDDLTSILDSTRSSALQDIHHTEEMHSSHGENQLDVAADAPGVVAVAKCLCLWFPQFMDCYRTYLQSHGLCSQSLRARLRTADVVGMQLQSIGEQKLVSLLIEPVQRLPRYNLYIDSIVKQLPARHPALKPLLRARDVITDICAENRDADVSNLTGRLRSRVAGWPQELEIKGRLVTAVDFVEMTPPYSEGHNGGIPGMLLLCTNEIVILAKETNQGTAARTFLTELESGDLVTGIGESHSSSTHNLRFIRTVELNAILCTESHDGRNIQLYTFPEPAKEAPDVHSPALDSIHVLRLENSYDGKAARFIEELLKTRVESTFGESERESTAWELRATAAVSDSIGLLSAVVEDSNAEFVNARNMNQRIRVFVDVDRHSQRATAGYNGVRTLVTISPSRDGSWRMAVDSADGNCSFEHIATADIVPLLRKTSVSLVRSRLAVERPTNAAVLLRQNAEILDCLNLQLASKENNGKASQTPSAERIRPARSPRKLLSTFLSSVGSVRDTPNMAKYDPSSHSVHHQMPRKPSPADHKPPSRESRPSSRDQGTPGSVSSALSYERLSTPLKKLEDTLSAYTMALQARKGNIVGKNLKMRASADELNVNELYNGLLEDPHMMGLAAQAPVDVLFAAFEKFLCFAWREQMGSVVSQDLLQEIQNKAETMFPADFDRYFQSALRQLAPPNQRAFTAIMKLLADLLDGTGNDSDRGILTAAFAEVLVTDGNPQDFIPLIDRFVDDTETYFGQPLEDVQKHHDGISNPNKRSRSFNSASVTSNTSSLRRKFGLGGLSRENSKSEPESKVASVLRTLGKSARGDASPANSISKGSRARPPSLYASTSRPNSQDGSSHSLFDEPPPLGRASSGHNIGLSTIGEHPSFIPTGPPRKKRRSSLSDVKALDTSEMLDAWSPPAARRSPLNKTVTGAESAASKPVLTGSPTKYGTGPNKTYLQSPWRPQIPASFMKENSPGPRNPMSTSGKRPASSDDTPSQAGITTKPSSQIPSLVPRASSPHKGTTAMSPPRTGLAERPGAENIVKMPPPQPSKHGTAKPSAGSPPFSASPTKLRMQSPQKVRDRLQNEQKSMLVAHSALQAELSKIGDELTSSPSPSRRGSVRTSPNKGGSSVGSASKSSSSLDLAQRVLKLEGQLQRHVEDATSRIAAMEADLATSLTVSETKCRKLDELYREANDENEALYARFNQELGRILKAVRGGDGVEELRQQLREAQEEVMKLKRETGRLRRENAGLRAQVRE